MKNILLLIVFAMFSISVSAHQNTKSFQNQLATTQTTHHASYTSMYTMSNGGFLQLIYNTFTKVGHVLYSTIHSSTIPKEQETVVN